MRTQKFVAIIITGLGNQREQKKLITWAVKDWEKKYDIKPVVYEFGWYDKDTLENKLAELLRFIKDINFKGNNVALIGCSAGASAALNVFHSCKEQVHSLINICGRVRTSTNVLPTLNFASRNSPLFKHSVIKCEENLKTLTKQDLNKITCYRAIFDEVVPAGTTYINGATNKVLPIIEHVLSIGFCLTIYSRNIASVIKSHNS